MGKMIILLVIAVFIFSPILLAGDYDAVTSATKLAKKECSTLIQYTDPGVLISVKAGEKFQISLKSNPTTGYKWRVDESKSNALLKLVQSDFIANDSKMVGSPGQEIWIFEPLKKGEAEIKFEYLREWEKKVAPVDIKMFKVKISK